MMTRSCWGKSTPAFWRNVKQTSAHLAAPVCALAILGAILAHPAVPQTKEAPKAAAKKKAAAKAPAPAAKTPAKAPAKTPTAAKTPAPKTAPASGGLAALVRAYRDNPSAARRTAIAKYAEAHANEESGALARLALGVGSYENRDYAGAVAALKAAKVPRIADYVAYYLAAARVEANDNGGVAQDLAPLRSADPVSPLLGRAWILEARALKGSDAAAAARLLREHYDELPQPEGDINLADCYQAAGDLANAAVYYQRVYYKFTAGAAATRAASAILTLKDTMGSAYPAPQPEQMLGRADRFFESREYAQARTEYRDVANRTFGLTRDQATVRMGATQFLAGSGTAGCSYLRGLTLPDSEAEAERLYYVEECGRRIENDDAMLAPVKKLAESFPKSPWRLRALLSAGNRFLVANRPDDYALLYKDAHDAFPGDPAAGTAHWKITFLAWMRNRDEATKLLREHLKAYPDHPTTGAALYFLGRDAEGKSDFGAANVIYRRLSDVFQNTYYAELARGRLKDSHVAGARPSQDTAQFLASLPLSERTPVPAVSTGVTTARIARSRLLRTAGLDDLADSELRYGATKDGQPALLALEMASAAEAPYLAVRILKRWAPEYLGMPLEAAPRRFWEFLFPLPYRSELFASARALELDPYLMAGLIRQESEFNPKALSTAKAYGLMQVRPSTGKLFARKAGVSRFSANVLYQPASNLKIGAAVLRSMLSDNNGRLEPTLAAYNAGPNRAADWLTWNTYREPAEFVESIPFTETRDYVQAVLRNAALYRRLYSE